MDSMGIINFNVMNIKDCMTLVYVYRCFFILVIMGIYDSWRPIITVIIIFFVTYNTNDITF